MTAVDRSVAEIAGDMRTLGSSGDSRVVQPWPDFVLATGAAWETGKKGKTTGEMGGYSGDRIPSLAILCSNSS